MIDFATLQCMSIPEGMVAQITDAAGNVLWSANNGKAVLEVEKIVSDTYAGETTYTGEEFILLDIYPKSGGTVSVTYGDLTKTITDDGTSEEPNAQQVFFGTFNGVSDSVATPASGELMIEGAYNNFAAGSYINNSKGIASRCGCITDVVEWGDITSICDYAFNNCTSIVSVIIPASVTSIGDYAFSNCTSIVSVIIPASVTSIGDYAFNYCTSIVSVSGIQCANIGSYAFYGCSVLSSIPLLDGVVSIGESAFQLGKETEITTMYGGSVVIPSTVQSIGKEAFATTIASDMEGIMENYLYTVQFLSTTPPTLGDGLKLDKIFGKGTSHSMIIPAGCSEAYKAVAGSWNRGITEVS